MLVSKPPAPEVAARLLGLARSAGKPVVVYFLGAPLPARRLGDLHFAASLSEAAEMAVEEGRQGLQGPPGRSPTAGSLRGLFSGGTLAYEAHLGLSAVLPPGRFKIIDLGADEFTVGRLHPMIDQDLRLRRLRQEAADPQVGLILLDVVLGEGAHADPAGELGPAIAEVRARRPDLDVAAVVIGTDEDPQDLARQIETLERAGARVFRTVGELVDSAVRRPGGERRGRRAHPCRWRRSGGRSPPSTPDWSPSTIASWRRAPPPSRSNGNPRREATTSSRGFWQG